MMNMMRVGGMHSINDYHPPLSDDISVFPTEDTADRSKNFDTMLKVLSDSSDDTGSHQSSVHLEEKHRAGLDADREDNQKEHFEDPSAYSMHGLNKNSTSDLSAKRKKLYKKAVNLPQATFSAATSTISPRIDTKEAGNNNSGQHPWYASLPDYCTLDRLAKHYRLAFTLPTTNSTRPWWAWLPHPYEMICFQQRLRQFLLTAKQEAKVGLINELSTHILVDCLFLTVTASPIYNGSLVYDTLFQCSLSALFYFTFQVQLFATLLNAIVIYGIVEVPTEKFRAWALERIEVFLYPSRLDILGMYCFMLCIVLWPFVDTDHIVVASVIAGMQVAVIIVILLIMGTTWNPGLYDKMNPHLRLRCFPKNERIRAFCNEEIELHLRDNTEFQMVVDHLSRNHQAKHETSGNNCIRKMASKRAEKSRLRKRKSTSTACLPSCLLPMKRQPRYAKYLSKLDENQLKEPSVRAQCDTESGENLFSSSSTSSLDEGDAVKDRTDYIFGSTITPKLPLTALSTSQTWVMSGLQNTESTHNTAERDPFPPSTASNQHTSADQSNICTKDLLSKSNTDGPQSIDREPIETFPSLSLFLAELQLAHLLAVFESHGLVSVHQLRYLDSVDYRQLGVSLADRTRLQYSLEHFPL